MLLENKIIIIIHNYNKLNCSHIKGYMIYLKLKIDNLILLEYSNQIKIFENNYFVKKDIELKNNKILFIKYLPDLEILKSLKDNKNILYHEILDFFYNKKYKNYDEYFYEYQINNNFIFDKLIVNSNYMKNKLIPYFNNIIYIYHHYDNRISNKSKIIPKVYYFGLKEKLELSDTTIKNNNIEVVNYNGIKKYLSNAFSCIHICFIFNKNILYDTYTSTKLATALATDSIFICNKIPIFVELLGEDYEFYCQKEEDLEFIINKAKNIINDKLNFNNYLEKYKNLKNNLTLNNLLKKYEELFN